MVTDYDYNHYRVSLGDDKSDNTARRVEGYPLDPVKEGNWPGQDANPNELHMDKQGMLGVADTIDGLIEDVGTIDVSQAGNVSFGHESWQAALFLKDASGQVAGAVNQYSRDLIANLQQASAAIRAAAGQYGGAEQGTSDSVSGVQSNLNSGSPTSGTNPTW